MKLTIKYEVSAFENEYTFDLVGGTLDEIPSDPTMLEEYLTEILNDRPSDHMYDNMKVSLVKIEEAG